MKALVAYFSASGVTAKVARAVAEARLLRSPDEARAWVG